MKKMVIAFLLFAATAFTQQIVLDNQSSYPGQDQKIAIQWANSAKEVDESNKSLMYEWKFNSSQLHELKQKGKVELTIPDNAAYFRIVTWSKDKDAPDFSTNWIDVVPGKTYTLKTEHLVPVVLMAGMGC